MRWFRRNKRDPGSDIHSQLAAQVLFEEVVEKGDSRLADGGVEDVYRASLIGGSTAVVSLLIQDTQMANLWGPGDLTKAERLVELWASAAALDLLQNQPDQENVCSSIAVGFASVVFDHDVDELSYELRALQRQQEADAMISSGGGNAVYTHMILRLLSLKALGLDLEFRKIPVPVPIPSVTEIIDLNITDSRHFGSPDEVLLLAQARAIGAHVANQTYADLK